MATVALLIGVVLVVGFLVTSGQLGQSEGGTEDVDQELQDTDEALDTVLGDYGDMDLSNFTVEDDL